MNLISLFSAIKCKYELTMNIIALSLGIKCKYKPETFISAHNM